METEGTLSNAWEQHLASEFSAKSADEALATMTANPYVNVVPLMIGARGRTELHDFYANHFLSQIPPDMEMVTVSRTIGQGRVVDELVARFTHSIRLDWLWTKSLGPSEVFPYPSARPMNRNAGATNTQNEGN